MTTEQRVKYPRTWHLPGSPGATSDDRVLDSLASFVGQEVILTEKMDGECTTMYRDGLHARSVDGRPHPSQDWVRGFHAKIAHEIPEGFRICGENLYARHSIAYDRLPSYFLGFSVWDNNVCLSWGETLEWFRLLGIEPVPALTLPHPFKDDTIAFGEYVTKHRGGEGFVIRLASEFTLHDFTRSVAKYVRANHVQTDQHWAHQATVPNGLMGATA